MEPVLFTRADGGLRRLAQMCGLRRLRLEARAINDTAKWECGATRSSEHAKERSVREGHLLEAVDRVGHRTGKLLLREGHGLHLELDLRLPTLLLAVKINPKEHDDRQRALSPSRQYDIKSSRLIPKICPAASSQQWTHRIQNRNTTMVGAAICLP